MARCMARNASGSYAPTTTASRLTSLCAKATPVAGFQSSTYRNEALGDYLTLRGYVQEFTVFPRRTLQTNFEDCKSCLHLYDHIYCPLGA